MRPAGEAFPPLPAAATHEQPESRLFRPESSHAHTTEEPPSSQPSQLALDSVDDLLPPMEPSYATAVADDPRPSLHEVQHVTHAAESQAVDEGQAPQAGSPLPSLEDAGVPLAQPGHQTGPVQVLQQLHESEQVSAARPYRAMQLHALDLDLPRNFG